MATYHHGNLREALVDAALVLLQDKGVGGLSLRGVARAAGVSQAAPYHHFKDKEALLAAVAQQGFERLTAAMQACRDVPDPLERLHAMGHAYVRFARANPHHYRVMFGSSIEDKTCYESLSQAGDTAFATLLEEIGGLQAAGLVGGDHPVPPAIAVFSAVHGIASLLVDGIEQRLPIKLDRLGVDTDLDPMVDWALRGITNGVLVRSSDE